jgi:hypothetical protein
MARTPRFDPYERLLYRFFEAVYLLSLLGNIRGPHLTTVFNPLSLISIRRRFLKNLAFLCDGLKGGDSTTSIAVQDRPECYVFWVSSNQGPSDTTLDFLRSVLEDVKAVVRSSRDEREGAENDLIGRCVEFSAKRMRNQAHSLVNHARRCREHLLAEPTDNLGAYLSSAGGITSKSLTRIQVPRWLGGCFSSRRLSSTNKVYTDSVWRHTGSETTRKWF